jgi:hypothetical protein
MYIFLELCTQAKIYAMVGLLILLYMIIKSNENTNADIIKLVIKAGVMIGVTFGINKLCTTGYKYIAWLLAFIPHIIVIMMLANHSP